MQVLSDAPLTRRRVGIKDPTSRVSQVIIAAAAIAGTPLLADLLIVGICVYLVVGFHLRVFISLFETRCGVVEFFVELLEANLEHLGTDL